MTTALVTALTQVVRRDGAKRLGLRQAAGPEMARVCAAGCAAHARQGVPHMRDKATSLYVEILKN